MVDRDKVIKGLECCAKDNTCDACPYDQDRYNANGPCALVRDTLELIKAQEPRVMTLEEVVEHYSLPPVLPDDLGMQEDYILDIEPLYFEFPNPNDWDVHWRGADRVNQYLERWAANYGKTWRVWTARPDEKRRAETPWES